MLLALSFSLQAQKYSWETKQATVVSTGDLIWAPQPFQFVTGSSVRYIDYEDGSDSNTGLSTSSAWRHHPWDPAATGSALSCTGIQTYVFKCGVIYRGTLTAKESGTAGKPIILTSDPSWGTGSACIYGSTKITSGWTKANATIAPDIPNADLVWYQNLPGFNDTKMVCETTGDTIKRVLVARSPNYKYTPNAPMSTWWSFTGAVMNSNGTLSLSDNSHLTQSAVGFYQGGTVWAVQDAIVMNSLWEQTINTYTPSTNTIIVANQNFGGVNCKYYVENTPYLLDTTGEFYYDDTKGNIFLRLDSDKNPNTTVVEIASKAQLINLTGYNNIVISGLTFRFTTYNNVRYGTTDGVPVILISGACPNITVKNCNFQYVNGGIVANGSSDVNNLSNLTITDNNMTYMDDFSIMMNNSNGYFLNNIHVLRNNIYDNGKRTLGRWYSSIPAIYGEFCTGEVAGNIVQYTWGQGVVVTWGKADGDTNNVSLVRGYVHHNKVSHSLIGCCDYGGIEGFQVGPAFYYDNVSYDASGYKYFNQSSLGYAYYFDGGFKISVFNNIARGINWNWDFTAYNQVLGYYDIFAQNDAFNVNTMFNSANGDLSPDGYNCYLANISDSTATPFNQYTLPAGVPFDSYLNNIFAATAFSGSFVNGLVSLPAFISDLNTYKPDVGEVGFQANSVVFTNPCNQNFSPPANSQVIDKGVKFFLPFPLKSVVGEWNFCKHIADSSLIEASNLFCTSDYSDRQTYDSIPKNQLKAYGLSDTSYVVGNLENWTKGALYFNGTSTYCDLPNSLSSANTCNDVNMTTNNFIIETYIKTKQTSGVIVSKFNNSGSGYQLGIDASGHAQIGITNEGAITYSVSSSVTVNNGNWHHILVEVNRADTVNIYIDSILSVGSTIGSMPSSGTSLTNTGDLYIGKNSSGNYFKGIIDFLRISKGILSNAQTTISELYHWEFNGPFNYDFNGNPPIGKRDAGAIEVGTLLGCNLQVSPTTLYFTQTGQQQNISVTATPGGFGVADITSNNYTLKQGTNELSVTSTYTSSDSTTSQFYIYGCNETQMIIIDQAGLPCSMESDLPDTIFFPASGETIEYGFLYNCDYAIIIRGIPITISKNSALDSLLFKIAANTSTSRIGSLEIEGCTSPLKTVLYQYGQLTGINGTSQNDVEVKPNPFTNEIYVNIPSDCNECKVTITDLSGRDIYNNILNAGNNEIDLPQIVSGFYLINISGNKVNYSTKIIKE